MENNLTKYVVHGLDPISEPELDALKRVSHLRDEEIDSSDIPEISPDRWKHAFPGMLRRFVRTHLMMKVDEDVIRWLRAKNGDDADRLVNDLLHREMEKEQGSHKSAA